jgi:glycosyltransferase involved in cell wall biosynthesis
MPMPPLSVVIICKNAAATVPRTIRSARTVSDDIVVVDSGSTDGTQGLVKTAGGRLIESEWLGYGGTKNLGNRAAKHDWILSLDADEALSGELIHSIRAIDWNNKNTVYTLKRLNYFGAQPIHFGEWRNDWVDRLFHRDVVEWNTAPVHENLIIPNMVNIIKLKGVLHHYTASSIDAYSKKLDHYAVLMAERYYARGKQSSALKIYGAPVFSFVKYFVFQLGLLDRKSGWEIAREHALYTFKKYKELQRLNKSKQ